MEELELHTAERTDIPAEEVTPDFVARIHPAVGAAVLDDEAILLDPATGVSHLLDAPGALVVRCLDGRSPLAEIITDIAEVLELDRDVVEADVVGLIRELGRNGLVDGVERDPHAGHRHRRTPEGVPVGADLSAWSGWAGLGGPTEATLLVNWGTSCGYCTRIAPELAELEPELRAAGTRLVLVTTGTEEAFREQVGDRALPVMHVDAAPDFFDGLGTPVAYLVGADRTVLEPLALGADRVPALARAVAEGRG